MPMNRCIRPRTRGFTLVELTIVIVIVALLVGGMLIPLAAQRDQRAYDETRRQLDEIREALIGHAIANRYFPCPARSTSDGNEDRIGTSCNGGKRFGIVPWVTLGLQPTDSWGQLFYYSVSPNFSDSTAFFTLTSPRDITIRTRDAGGVLINQTNVGDIPVAFLSVGKNAYWGLQLGAAAKNPDSAGSNNDEDSNASDAATGVRFVSRTPSPATATGGEFDDVVAWIPPSILFARMIAAGRPL